MAFNPIRDLNPGDRQRAITELGGIQPRELDNLSSVLRVTERKTREIVDLLRRKNLSFSQETNRITRLDEQLNRSIPIIPPMPGEAGSIFGAGNRGFDDGGGFGFPFLPPFGLPGGPRRGPGGRPGAPSRVPTPEQRQRESEAYLILEQDRLRSRDPYGYSPEQADRDQEDAKREAEAARKKRQEELDKLQRASEILEEVYGVPAPPVPLVPQIYPPGFNPPQVPLLPKDPDIKRLAEQLQQYADKTGQPQVVRTPNNYKIFAFPNRETRIYTPKQTFVDDVLTGGLTITQGVLDALPAPSVRIPARQRPGVQQGPRPKPAPKPTVTPVTPAVPATTGARQQQRAARAETQRRRQQRQKETAAEQSRRSYQSAVEKRKQEAERRRKNALDKELEEQRRQIEQYGLEQRIGKLEDEPDIMAQIAKTEAERSERDFFIENYFGKKIDPTSPDYDSAAAELRSRMEVFLDPSFDVPLRPGSVGLFMDLQKPQTRARFIEYLLGANPPKGKDINVNFINSILRAVGLEKTGSVNAIDFKTTKFMMNFMKNRLNADPSLLYEELKLRGMLRLDQNETRLIEQRIPKPDQPELRIINPGESGRLSSPIEGETSYMPRKTPLDIASLNKEIDNVQIVYILTGTTIG